MYKSVLYFILGKRRAFFLVCFLVQTILTNNNKRMSPGSTFQFTLLKTRIIIVPPLSYLQVHGFYIFEETYKCVSVILLALCRHLKTSQTCSENLPWVRHAPPAKY